MNREAIINRLEIERDEAEARGFNFTAFQLQEQIDLLQALDTAGDKDTEQ